MNDDLNDGYYWVQLNSGPEPWPPEPAWYSKTGHEFARMGNEFGEGADQFIVLGPCEIGGDEKVQAIMADEIKRSHAVIDELAKAVANLEGHSNYVAVIERYDGVEARGCCGDCGRNLRDDERGQSRCELCSSCGGPVPPDAETQAASP